MTDCLMQLLVLASLGEGGCAKKLSSNSVAGSWGRKSLGADASSHGGLNPPWVALIEGPLLA